jgi:hypothetical protein
MAYDIGDMVRIYGTFRASTFTVTDGVPASTEALADPTTVTLTVQPPGGGQLSSYTWAAGEVTRASEGVFYRDIPLTLAGRYLVRWIATGAVAAAAETAIRVDAPRTA